MIFVGIDEAGRGCVIGPLVIAAVAIKKESLHVLKKIGVRDSKLLSKKRREEMFEELLEKCENIKIVKISPKVINNAMEKNISLNKLELKYFVKLIKKLGKVNVVYVDCTDVKEERFENEIKKRIDKGIKVISMHKADLKIPIVSAASIVAKVVRDNEIEKIKKKVGYDFGSGYPSDKKTIEFLKKAMLLPEVKKHLRKKWRTLERLKQRRITEFF
ncbi:MAG: ribonuclease HII [Candidatus Micrarchaeia archaeon]